MKNLLQKKLLERFHVTPRVGAQFSGVLLDEDKTYAVFGGVIAYKDDDTPVKVEGELFIRHDNISYLQRVVNAY